MRFKMILLASLLTATTSSGRADIVFYQIPKIKPAMTIVLQGSAKVLAGGNVSFRHPKFRGAPLIFSLANARIQETLSPRELFELEFRQAVASGDADQVMQAANWALNHGLLEQFHEAIEKTLELDPQHSRANQVVNLQKLIEQPVEITDEHRSYMKSVVPINKMRFETSHHFLLMCDTPTNAAEYRKLPRAQERLELLELVYQCFLYRFYAHDAKLSIPTDPLMVVLFNDEPDFRDYSTKLSPKLASAAGFWDAHTNVSFFYDHGTTEEYQAIRRFSGDLQRLKDQYVRDKQLYAEGEVAKFVRMANTMALLVEISQENSDIEVVSHEITHQMAGNTGLFPRDVMVPTWVHEGLATFFESPKDATWSGIGAVNDERLRWYRGLEQDREHSNIDFVVSDRIFKTAASPGATLHGYGQAWGLTHFLMNQRFDELMKFYRRLGEMPPDLILSPDVLTRLFTESFGEDRDGLDLQWRSYMRSLKTDLEVYIDTARR